jgi:TonB-dependent receptor
MKISTLLSILILATIIPAVALCQQTGTITGVVTDVESKDVLIGANIVIKGTSLGTVSDIYGRYTIKNVSAGAHTLRIGYVGYESIELPVQLKENATMTRDIRLKAVGVQGEEVVITAQAQGQKAAINQQLAATQIKNVVDAARIKELPDANAAESIGRMPGVFLVRSYGEGSQVAIRGMEPKYNQITIEGVEMPSSASGDRSVDLSMISSSMLSGIEIFKSVTPDMDAAVLGGSVNFQIREAQVTASGAPTIDLSLQGGYNRLKGSYDDYNFSGTVGHRFFDDGFGVLAQGVVERKNLTANIFGGDFFQKNKSNYFNPPILLMHSLNLSYKPVEQNRYNGTLVTDYKWTSGKIALLNFFSKSTRDVQTFSQNYGMGDNNYINFGASSFSPVTNQITNILSVKQDVSSFSVNGKLSHSYTENINPGYWGVTFNQVAGVNLNSISANQSPEVIAQQAFNQVNQDTVMFGGISTNSSFTRQRNISGALDIERDVNFSDFITSKVKFGGMVQHAFRSYDYSSGTGSLGTPANSGARASVVSQFPWMAQAPYNMNTNGNTLFPMKMFFDRGSDFGKFLNGDYAMRGFPTDISLLSQVVNNVVNYQRDKPFAVSNAYSPDAYDNIANDYSGDEYRKAAYVMATLNVGPQLTIIPGVRYQGLKTEYTAAHIPTAYNNNTYPYPFPKIDTTVTQYHEYWLPDVTVRYRMYTWLDLRFSYTNTITYPDFNYIVPMIHIFTNSVDWNNYQLKPARSRNFDFSMSIYDNTVGLLTVNPFLKRIDDLIMSPGTVHITDPSAYPGLPASVKSYTINTRINNPKQVDLWGVEADWQTNFWYLPNPLKGLVFNINYTHIFSSAEYPFVMRQDTGSFPRYGVKFIDTTYTDRLLDQPSNIVNLSIGYDYQGFSARGSMIYQADVFTGTSFWEGFRSHKAKYVRWDFTARQKLPVAGWETFFDINNLNSEPDINVIQGNGYPTSQQLYGLTATIGLRWKLD